MLSSQRCTATTGTACVVDGQSHFQCELEQGHADLHSHTGELFRGSWEDNEHGGRTLRNVSMGRKRDWDGLGTHGQIVT